MSINIPVHVQKVNCVCVILRVAHYFSLVLGCTLVLCRLVSSWQPPKWFRGCQGPRPVLGFPVLSEQSPSSLLWLKRPCKISFLTHFLTWLSTAFRLIHHSQTHWISSCFSRCQVCPCLAFHTGCSLCPVFSLFLIFLWLFLSCYSLLSLYDASLERPFVTTKSRVATRIVACTLPCFSSLPKVDNYILGEPVEF